MRGKMVIHNLGSIAILLSVSVLIPAIIAGIYGEISGILAFLLTSIIAAIIGYAMNHFGTKGEIFHKGAFVTAGSAWILASIIGAFPYFFMGFSFLDALFESLSGFTTTGATLLTEVDFQGYWTLDHEIVESSLAYMLVDKMSNLVNIQFNDTGTFFGLLFWRSFSQFLGGMGIILLFLAILPNLGISGRRLYSVEGLGMTKETITPHVRKTAEIFWSIYIGLAAIEAVILIGFGMPLYDAICTALTSLATGGFSPRASSIASYNSPFIDAIVIIFLVIGGTSFLLHYKIIFKRDFLAPLKDAEFRFYISIMVLSIVILLLWGRLNVDLPTQLRYSIFQVASIMTTTGFVNNLSYDNWSLAAKFVLIILMLVGGCVGSTGGGIKVGRVLIILKYAYSELLHAIHPQIVTSIKVDQNVVSEDILRSIQIYIILYLMIFLGASLAFTITESNNPDFDAISAISASACTLGVIGPGYGVVALDFAGISPPGIILGIICMYVGRLEIITALVLFLPNTWKGTF